MIKKGFSLAVIIAVVMIGFMQKDVWLSMIRAGGMYAVLMSILLVAADVFFPIVPFAIIAALNGAVFGIVNGVWITLSGAMLGTMALFFLVRYGFRDWARKSCWLTQPRLNMKIHFISTRLRRCFSGG